jgi:hypothetical protein
MRRVVVAALAAFALYSAWHAGGHVWRHLGAQRHEYAALTEEQRRRYLIERLPLPADVFDFYADRVRKGDRIYFHVMPSGFGPYFDLPGIVAAVGRFYLLPAVQVADVRDATVVLSYYADPGELGLHFATQVQAGQQPIYVSRLGSP